NFLDGDAQLVAAPRVQCFKLLRLFDDLAGPARQLGSREIGHENVTTRHNERIARRQPIPPGKPERALEHKLPVAFTLDGGLSARERDSAAMFKVNLESCYCSNCRLLPLQTLDAFLQQQIKVPRRAELFGEPISAPLEVLCIRLFDKLL